MPVLWGVAGPPRVRRGLDPAMPVPAARAAARMPAVAAVSEHVRGNEGDREQQPDPQPDPVFAQPLRCVPRSMSILVSADRSAEPQATVERASSDSSSGAKPVMASACEPWPTPRSGHSRLYSLKRGTGANTSRRALK